MLLWKGTSPNLFSSKPAAVGTPFAGAGLEKKFNSGFQRSNLHCSTSSNHPTRVDEAAGTSLLQTAYCFYLFVPEGLAAH